MLLSQIILKSVTAPAQLILASVNATLVAMVGGVVGFVAGGVLIGIIAMISLQLLFIAWTFKDPHFVEVIMARCRCRKTYSLTQEKKGVSATGVHCYVA